jgi:1-acyl-sn-glycerol-3-phosphate acyltransferase
MPFHGGPAILALGQGVPVLPIYIKGASEILPPGTRESRPAPVVVRIGRPLSFAEGTAIGEAKHTMEEAVRALAGDDMARAA